ncbi:MAG: IS630 family transposase [Chloroflexi bacterium]|nr:IS630 family transposase [Chloroflexota bacterium]
MPFAKTRADLVLSDETRSYLAGLTRSREASVAQAERARIMLAYADGQSVSAIARELGTNRPKVERCLDKALQLGPRQALRDLPRSGRPPVITPEARAWVVSLACQKPKALGYSYELWTLRLLAQHVQEHCDGVGHPSLRKVGRGAIQRLLSEHELKPHRIRYYLERRDPDFDAKMAQVLCIYHQVALARAQSESACELVAYLSYDEKPGIQAIENLAPDLLPVAGEHPCISRDHQYRRHGTVTLLAGLDLSDGRVYSLVEDRHRSREFVAFLRMLDERYPPAVALRIILDNHSAHTSKETRAYLATRPNRFEFIFTPTHGSWLNLVEALFAKMAKTLLRGLRVASRQELKDRILQFVAEMNEAPVVFRWSHGIEPVTTQQGAAD